jgi:hypothetical protein
LLVNGNDFSHENAFSSYYYYDKMIKFMNTQAKYSKKYFLRYSTPSEYIDAIYPCKSLFSVYKQGNDIFQNSTGFAYD